MFKNYLKVAVRILFRHKGYSAINIAGLAVGMACCIIFTMQAIFELSFDRFHEKADQLYRLINIQTHGGKGVEYAESSVHVGVNMGLTGEDMKNEYPEVLECARFQSTSGRMQYKDKKLRFQPVYLAESSVFKMFSFKLIAGDEETALSEPYSVVVTEETALRLFGDEDPLGKVILKDGETGYKITGVVKDIPANSHIQFEMLMSYGDKAGQPKFKEYGSNYLSTYLLLQPGADVKALENKFPDFAQRHMPGSVESNQYKLYLQPLKEVHLHSSHIRYSYNHYKGDITYVYFYCALAVIVLLIACVNFINLSTARSTGRSMEVGMRKVAGAGRLQLIGQFLGESVFLSFCSLLLAVCLIELSLPVLSDFFSGTTGFFGNVTANDFFGNWVFVLVSIGLALIVGVIAGSYPAFVISAFKPVVVLKGAASSGSKGLLLRRLLVVAQFTASIILVICVLLVVRQLNYLRNENMGFNKDQVIVLPITGLRQSPETIRHELLQHPDITGVTASEGMFGQGNSESSFHFDGQGPDEKWMFSEMPVDYDFLSFYGLELTAGRDFSREMATDLTDAAIVNETFARELGWESSLGKKITFGTYSPPNFVDRELTIIGVVKDFNFYSLHKDIETLVMYMNPARLQRMHVRIRPENMASTLEFIEEQWTSRWSSADHPFEYTFLDEHLDNLYHSEERAAIIIGAFSLLTIFVSCLGLLGLISFSVQQRTKEIGIRKVLGASVSNIVLLLSKEFLMLLGIAIVIACPVAWYAMDRWLQNFAYRIELGPETFVLGGVIALVITVLTVSFQAVKAATANPVDALRYE